MDISIKPNKNRIDKQSDWKKKIKKRLNKSKPLKNEELRFILNKILEIT